MTTLLINIAVYVIVIFIGIKRKMDQKKKTTSEETARKYWLTNKFYKLHLRILRGDDQYGWFCSLIKKGEDGLDPHQPGTIIANWSLCQNLVRQDTLLF